MNMPKNPSSESLVFAVDLGGTHLRVALIDDGGRIFKQLKQETPKGDSALCIVNALVNTAQQWDSDKLPVVATSIMVPGAVDSEKAVVLQAPNLPSLVNFKLKAELERRLGWGKERGLLDVRARPDDFRVSRSVVLDDLESHAGDPSWRTGSTVCAPK